MITKTLTMHTQYPEIVAKLLSERDLTGQAPVVDGNAVTIEYTTMAFATETDLNVQVWIANAQGCGLIQSCVDLRERNK